MLPKRTLRAAAKRFKRTLFAHGLVDAGVNTDTIVTATTGADGTRNTHATFPGWNASDRLEAYPKLHRGRHDRFRLANSAQFPLNLIRESEKTASKQFRYDALADAPARSKRSRVREG